MTAISDLVDPGLINMLTFSHLLTLRFPILNLLAPNNLRDVSHLAMLWQTGKLCGCTQLTMTALFGSPMQLL